MHIDYGSPEIISAIANAKKTESYLAQQKRLISIQEGFSVAIAAIWLTGARRYHLTENSLSFVFTHDAFQAMAAITFLALEGKFAPAKRELRYLLESVAKHAFVDLSLYSADLEERIDFLDSKVERSSVDFIKEMQIFGLSSTDEVDFRCSVKSKYKELSAFVHRSPTQIRKELQSLGKGPPEPKLIAAELERFNRDCFAIYDMAVFLQFQVLGSGMTGDVLLKGFDDAPNWPFHKGKFCRLLSKFYDYKVEWSA